MSRLLLVVVCVFLAGTSCRADDDDHGTNADQYTTEQFKENVPKTPHFVMFYAPWCGHCKRLAPTFDQLGTKYNVEGERKTATIAKVDCTVETALCSDEGVTGYPTLKFIGTDAAAAEKYRGPRDYDTLDKYIQDQLNPGAAKKDEPAAAGGAATKSEFGLYELTDATFKSHVEKGIHFIKFYAPWCGHCKRLAPTWDELARTFKDDKDIRISKIDCTQSSATCQAHEVKGYPTLLLFKDGKMAEKYSGSRDHDKLKAFIEKKAGKDANAARTDEKVPKGDEKSAEVAGLSILTGDNFKATVEGKKAFVKFYAPWCGHCKRLAPTWDELAQAYKDEDIIIGKVDCTVDRQLCTDHEVKGYPTLLFIKDGKAEKYSSGRELKYLKKFVDKALGVGGKDEDEKKQMPRGENVVQLTDDTFEKSIATGVKFIMFYAPWCGHCKNLAPTWKDLGDSFKTHPEVVIAKVDCTEEKATCKDEEVNGFPTLILYKNGEDIGEHEGGRDLISLKEFILSNIQGDQFKDDDIKDDEDDDEVAEKDEL